MQTIDREFSVGSNPNMPEIRLSMFGKNMFEVWHFGGFVQFGVRYCQKNMRSNYLLSKFDLCDKYFKKLAACKILNQLIF